jgi:hypothetical protein
MDSLNINKCFIFMIVNDFWLREAFLYPTAQAQYSTQVSDTASIEPSSHNETNIAYLSTLLKPIQHVRYEISHCSNGEAFAFRENISIKEYCYFGGYGTLWSCGQSSWLQIQRSGFDSQRYQIFWVVVGLELGPLSLVSTIEELFERKSSGSGLENREFGLRDPSRWPYGTPYSQSFPLNSPTSGGRCVGIVRWRTEATEFSLV